MTARATAKSLMTMRLLYWAALAAIAWPTLLSGGAQGQEASEQPTGLFSPVPVAIPSAVSSQPGGRRSRFVEVDFTGLGGRYGAGPAHGRLDLTLFPGESYAAVLDRVETTYAGRSWIGHVDGIPSSYVLLTVVRGALAGSISWPGGHSYRVSPAHEGLHTISEVDAGAPIQDLTVTPPFDALEADNALDRISAAAVADDPSTIDVLVVYNSGFREENGGEAGAAAAIDLALSFMNVALANSGIGSRFRLVYMTERPFALPANCDTQLLRAVREPSDGYLDEIHMLRDAYGADLVNVSFGRAGSAVSHCSSMAFISTDSTFGFSVSTGPSAHEFGHNLGAYHEWFLDDTRVSAHGYSDCANGFKDIMAYGVECWVPGARPNFEIPYFANPAVTYQGHRVGVPVGTSLGCRAGNRNNPPCDADLGLAFRNSIPRVANYRLSRYVPTTFPPRNETADFREQLELKYRDGLRRGLLTTYANAEGAVVWTQEYLRYRLGQCSHVVAMAKVQQQIRGQGLAGTCGSAPAGMITFPPRDETFAFRIELERLYRVDLRSALSETRVDPEGDVVWIQEYLRYRLNGCDHPQGVARVMLQVDGAAAQPVCR